MRIGFLISVLIIGMVIWQVIEKNAGANNKEVIVRQALPMDIPYEKSEALSHLNTIREAMSMQLLQENKSLKKAAQAHADYLVENDESTHDEIEGHKGFLAIKAVERAFASGYRSSHVIENLSTKNENAHSSVNGLFSAIYHRFSFLNLDIDEIGVGIQQDQKHTAKSAFVYNMGNSEINRLCSGESFRGNGKYVYGVCKNEAHRIQEKRFHTALNHTKKYNPKIIVYPYDGQKEVPPAFYDEVPDPLPYHEVSGFPVSIEFSGHFFDDVTFRSFKLYKDTGEEITEVQLMNKHTDPHQMFTKHQYALFPLKRLAYDTEYQAEVVYVSKGKEEKIVWRFKTETPQEILHIVIGREESLRIKHGESYMIYFKPLDEHEIISNIQFSSDVYIEFLDNHTIKMNPMTDDLDSFDIISDTRILHVEVE